MVLTKVGDGLYGIPVLVGVTLGDTIVLVYVVCVETPGTIGVWSYGDKQVDLGTTDTSRESSLGDRVVLFTVVQRR